MKYRIFIYLLFLLPFLNSCLTVKEIRYAQPSENLILDENGYIPYNIPVYRVNKNDVLQVNIITLPNANVSQFYPNLGTAGAGSSFSGLTLDENGYLNVFGMGLIKAEGLTTNEIAQEIQKKVDENFLPGQAQVQVKMEGIKFWFLTDVEGKNSVKTSNANVLTLYEAIAESGGLDRTVDRRHVRLFRKYPEGFKMVTIDLTKEDIMNSKYFYVQNGDMIMLDSKRKSLYGFNQGPVQTMASTITVFTTALGIYLLFSRF